MSGGGVQITIPDFDDDDYSGTTPLAFGRGATDSPFGFGAGFGARAGHESPTSAATPLAFGHGERSYFQSHSRNDSAASEDSTQSLGVSTRYTAITNSSKTTFHSSQSSIAAPSAIPKKSSFASLRNAFKSGGSKSNTEAPPVPSVSDAYPALKNPFNRSGSTLGKTSSPPFGRPPTPGGTPFKSRHKGANSNARSQHSHNGSIFHASDNGSDHLSQSVPRPPVPPVPHNVLNSAPVSAEPEDDKLALDPKTPSDFALHAIFLRFATSAEERISAFLKEPMDSDPQLPDFMGPGVCPPLDDSMSSLGKIAQRHAKPVVDSVLRWRRSQQEAVGADMLSYHATRSPSGRRNTVHADIPGIMTERKSLAAIYIMCRAFIIILKAIEGIRDALSQAQGYGLEENVFEQFKKPNLKLLVTSENHRTNAELYARLLGHIANIRFITVTDRFLAELEPISAGNVPKDLDMKYENLVKGMRHIKIKVWPTESFVEGAEFIERLANAFTNAHGTRLKIVFAETLLHLLHPIVKTAQVETNDPTWRNAIEIIYPRAREMANKPRYWSAAFPLVITSLCAAPHDFFLKHWMVCFEAYLPKLKEKSQRITIMNGLLRLVWTYLYRCQESTSSTTSKLETILKHFFPSNRLTVFPGEECTPALAYIVHFILSRQFEFGRDLCLDLIQESAISSTHVLKDHVAPERTQVAVHAFLLSLHLIEREETKPSWPSGTDFSVLPDSTDYPGSPEYAPASVFAKASIQQLFNKCSSTLAIVATSCAKSVGQMSVLDDQWAWGRNNQAFEESHNFIIRRHDNVTIAYPHHLVPQINLLKTCFGSWPRLLHPTIATADAVDMLIKGVMHVEPSLAMAAADSLRRFMGDPDHAIIALSRFTSFFCNAAKIARESAGLKLLVEWSPLLNLWVELLDKWVDNLLSQNITAADVEKICSKSHEFEAGALFLLSHQSDGIRTAGVTAVRMLGLLIPRLASAAVQIEDSPLRIIDSLHKDGLSAISTAGMEEILGAKEMEYLTRYRNADKAAILLRIADSTTDVDRALWRHLFPIFLQKFSDEGSTPALTLLRETLVASTTRYIPLISHLAGLSSRAPIGLTGRSQGGEKDVTRLVRDNQPLSGQWFAWVKILCATAVLPEPRPAPPAGREHSRAPSDSNAMFEREKLSSTRGLFRYLTPFLDSEYEFFRDAAVCCVSCMPSMSYPQLLEDLGLLANRQFHEDPRLKSTIDDARMRPGAAVERIRRQERLRSAVTRIYFLTAHHLGQQRSMGKQVALGHVLKFVRNAQILLSSAEVKENHTLQKLRRYFCGIVEQLFDGLASLSDSGRFIQPNMHLTLYRLCEEWCQFGPPKDVVKRRLIAMQRAAAVSEEDRSDAVERFQKETTALSEASIGALSALCQKPLFTTDSMANSPTEKVSQEYTAPLTPSAVLERLCTALTSIKPGIRAKAQKALRFLLTAELDDKILFNDVLIRATVLEEQLDTSNAFCFEVVADIICKGEPHQFSFAQIVYLGLVNLCHASVSIRQQAFDMLQTVHKADGLLSMAHFETSVRSLAPSVYGRAHQQVSDFLSGEHPQQAVPFLAQLNLSLPLLATSSSSRGQVLLLSLQSLEAWISYIDLMNEDKSAISPDGIRALYHLMALTLRYGQSHGQQILALWTKLVEYHQSNALATVKFLLEQAHKVGNASFIKCASHIVACLCHAPVGASVCEELCSIIEPAQMLPNLDHKVNFPGQADQDLWSELDVLFGEQPRLQLGSAQFAWLFLAEVSIDRAWDFKAQLPVFLHSLFTHFDNRNSFVRQQARKLLFQVLRSCVGGYDELPDRSSLPSVSNLHQIIDELEGRGDPIFWKEEDGTAETDDRMKRLCERVLSFLGPLSPRLAERWGSLALTWGTSCTIRSTAFRSLQIFRSLMSQPTKSDLALLLGRLSNTVAGSNSNIQSFTSEILLTLKALVSRDDIDSTQLPQFFWCACACLETPVEQEFIQAVELLNAMLSRIDLDDPATTNVLITQRPHNWVGSDVLQPTLLKGLRSSNTSDVTLKTLQMLAKVNDGRLIDTVEGRLRDLYTAALPWCLQAMANPEWEQAPAMRIFAEDISRLAKEDGHETISRIMASFSKGHFRTKDDFLRQSVASLREHYGGEYWRDIATLLLGLVLNNQTWLRAQAMNILKVLFQQREARKPMDLVGSELLMPLLRLLDTELAAQALEVLEEPFAVSGGPAAKHVLRMSKHLPTTKDTQAVADVFGVPEESGWCVPKVDTLRESCQANVMSVFDECSLPSSRPSRIDFEPEVEVPFGDESMELSREHFVDAHLNNLAKPIQDDLGGLVQDLHELTSYFQVDQIRAVSEQVPSTPLPTLRLEARVAAILAKSTAQDSGIEMPQTPFVDVFKVGGHDEDSTDDSDNYSDTDSEDDDAFIFDSPTMFRAPLNGKR